MSHLLSHFNKLSGTQFNKTTETENVLLLNLQGADVSSYKILGYATISSWVYE